MKKLFGMICVVLAAFIMTGCGERAPTKDELSIRNADILDSYRATTISNAESLARDYRESNPRLSGMKVVMHPDLMMTSECLQGSGWIWVSFMGEKNEKTKEVEKYKAYCSTHSSQMGCFLEKDFIETAFYKELKQCNLGIKLPFKSFTGK